MKVIVRIRGGIGNQLFCYAAARRLATANGVELVIDDVTSYARDRRYYRKYALDNFQIKARKAKPLERFEPFSRLRRRYNRWLALKKPFAERRYLKQEFREFDERLLTLKVTKPLYLDGLWQSEDYFKDIESTIREELQVIPPSDEYYLKMGAAVRDAQSVALHMRWFLQPGREDACSTARVEDYYRRAIEHMDQKLGKPRYYLFSNAPQNARALCPVPEDRLSVVSPDHDGQTDALKGFDQTAIAELWLMTQCRHFITAHSTFSWWGAWLGGGEDKIVITPDQSLDGKYAWGFAGQIPSRWIRL